MLSFTVMQFVDSLMVSKVGPLEVAAQGNGGIWAFTPQSFLFGFLSVVNTFVAQSVGAGRRDAPARFHTMDRAVRWSYDLLDPGPRRLLRTLSVFRGGADLDLLADCCGRLGDPALPGELPALARASLVHEQAGNGQPRRFTMLAPIRMFAEAELAREGERERAESAHLDTFAAVARDAGAGIVGSDAAIRVKSRNPAAE